MTNVDLISNLDPSLFDNDSPMSDRPARVSMQTCTDDEIYRQYNESIVPSMAKAILGKDYNDNGKNFRLCSDVTGSYVTYDLMGEEVVVRLEENRQQPERQIRDEVISDPKPKKPILAICMIVGMVLLVAVAIFLMVVMKNV